MRIWRRPLRRRRRGRCALRAWVSKEVDYISSVSSVCSANYLSKAKGHCRSYGGSSRLGFLSRRSSPSFGGGINGSGGHDVMLCGVFQGTVGCDGSEVVDACRRGAILRRHWVEICCLERPRARANLGEFIVRKGKAELRAYGGTPLRPVSRSSHARCLAQPFGSSEDD